MTEAKAREILQRPVFADPQHIEAARTLAAAGEIDEAIRKCPHYYRWELSDLECCAAMMHYSSKFPEVFSEKMHAFHGTKPEDGQW